ncbi:hypothetical protein GCM10023340_40540 [Nocardioides marinquilinus]|uniref:Carboxypeptidase regulatory-like domain-containing protein n=1 Tax=Nocardioides marinquilinus TaxID=1210400 RepID=A0ABP9Q2H3_9ACTN
MPPTHRPLRPRVGTLVVRLDAPGPGVARVSVSDAAGRVVRRRRVLGPVAAVELPPGRYRVTADDDRGRHDPRRLASAVVDDVPVAAGEAVEVGLVLRAATVVEVTTDRWARVTALQPGGPEVEARADGRGRAVLTGLGSGPWSLVAHDPRTERCSVAVAICAAPGVRRRVSLPADRPTAGLLVSLRGTDRRPVRAGEVVVVDSLGRRVVAPVRAGVADVRGLRPGRHTVVVPASVGHLGTTLAVAALAAGDVGAVEVVVPVGATVTGRVVLTRAGLPLYAAVVSLLDAGGTELERTRTGDDGRFELGTGLRRTEGLTVVATTGPETLHVTRAAVADLDVVTGVRHDVGDVVLPATGPPAAWTARARAAATRRPSPRV